jgi:sortase A
VEPEVVVGAIEIPRLGISTYLFEGVTDGTLDRGPGHWPGTAMPGQIGNVVVAGHRVSKHRVFRHLDQLQPGDEVRFTTTAGRFTYRVTGSMVVLPADMWIVSQAPQRVATLFACHPPGSTRERFVVFAELVP